MNAPHLRAVESCEAAHREPSAPGSEAQVAVCAVPTCTRDAGREMPLCPACWDKTPTTLRGRWVVAVTELRQALRWRTPAVGRWARAVVAAEAALVASLPT